MKEIEHPIPSIMQDRPVDSRGYVVPYFTPVIDGKPDFRFQDSKKREICLKRMLCSVCGKRLFAKSFWFISGPVGLENTTASDAPMHEQCARYSLSVCPHLQYHKAERRSDSGPYVPEPYLLLDKPESLFLIKADKFHTVQYGRNSYIKFRPTYIEKYVYENNLLVRAKENS